MRTSLAFLAFLALHSGFAPPARPADYFTRPVYQVGLPGRPTASQVTAEGYLNNGYAEFTYYTGVEMAPVDGVAISCAPDGRPLLHGRLERDGFRYEFQYFSAPLALGGACPPQVDVVRVRIANLGFEERQAHFWAGMRAPDSPGRWCLVGYHFSFGWHYEFRRNAIIREMQVMGVYPRGSSARYAYPGRSYGGMFGAVASETTPTSPVLLARYELPIAPGRDTTLTFYYPAEPAPDSYAGLLNSMSSDTLRARFDATWDDWLRGLPAMHLGERKLDEFVRGNLALGLLQVRADLGLPTILSNKNRRPAPEPLDMVRVLRLWQRLGMGHWTRLGMDGLRAMHREGDVLLSTRDGRAATAGLLGIESELALDPPSAQSGGHASPAASPACLPPGDSLAAALARSADSLAAWCSPGAPRGADLLELATSAWALNRYAGWLACAGRAGEAARRLEQSRVARARLEERLQALPDSALARGEPALGWLGLSGGMPTGKLGVLTRERGWRLSEGMACVGDSAFVGRSLDRVAALPDDSEAGARGLLSVVAHSTVQGGLPATFNIRRRDFDLVIPPEAVEGSRAARELLDRVVSDVEGDLALGRGLPAVAPGESLVVGPLLVSGDRVTVQANYRARAAGWTWRLEAGAAGPARVRVFAPPGARVTGGGGTLAPDSTYAAFPATAGGGAITWRPGPGHRTLAEFLAQAGARAANPRTPDSRRPGPGKSQRRR
ncbi:MAG: hypothetical protein HZB25_01530 [Candidatus Eisenbacteria bacterium]|nr:hypothetical protein [Candidatus Eisenbacteria bacterium]